MIRVVITAADGRLLESISVVCGNAEGMAAYLINDLRDRFDTIEHRPHKFKAGDRAIYRGDFGNFAAVGCTILEVGEKNGRRVYDCQIDGTGELRWGYQDQFEELRS